MEDRLPVMKKDKPRKRSNRKLLLFLFLFFVTLLLILFFQSSLSQITEITVSGQHLVAEEEIRKSAGIATGDHFFSSSSSRIESQIKKLRMIESVEVKKRFPGRIEIVVHEYPKVAYQFADNGQVEALLSDGSIVPVSLQKAVLDKPILSGWSQDDPNKLLLCLTMAKLPNSAFDSISEIMPTPSAAYPDRIKMYTRSQFEIITTVGYLPQKMPNLDTYIASLSENKITSGVLTLLEADSHAPFEQAVPSGAKNNAGKATTKP